VLILTVMALYYTRFYAHMLMMLSVA